jgi:hypothetical protein
MKRLFAAFKEKSSEPEAQVVDDQSVRTVSVDDIVMPDIYGDEHVATVPDLKIINLSSSDAEESTGFNPYDTAVLRKK